VLRGEPVFPPERRLIMAVPKRRTSVARKRKRRSHLALQALNLDRCPRCLEPKEPHRVCRVCGTYKGREVLPVEGAEA
jgi:large subunit ribosomal protein L32